MNTVESVNAKEYFTKLLQIIPDEIQIYLVINSGCVIAICENENTAQKIKKLLKQFDNDHLRWG